MDLGVNLNGILEKIGRPLPTFTETWQSLDAAVWDVTDPATGTAWTAPTVVNGAGGNIYCLSAPNALENAKIISKQHFSLNTADESYIKRKLILEFEAKFVDPANISSVSLFGMADGGGVGVVFKVSAGVLWACSPVGHVPIDVSFLKGGLLTNQNKFRIELSKGAHTLALNRFLINDKLAVTLDENSAVQPTNIWDGQIDFDFTALAAAFSVYVGMVRLWYKDTP